MAIKYLKPSFKNSLNQKFRSKRFNFFIGLLNTVQSEKQLRILDIGGEENYWERMNFLDTEMHITLLNIYETSTKGNNIVSIKGDAADLSRFKDNEFDIVFSNSVIEHLFSYDNQKKMADEARRVGKYYYVQTPNYYFPVEPHWLFPFFQFLPFNTRVFLTKNFNLGHRKKTGNKDDAIKSVAEVKLLTERQMKNLFPDGKVYKEMLLGFKKSVTMYRFPEN